SREQRAESRAAKTVKCRFLADQAMIRLTSSGQRSTKFRPLSDRAALGGTIGRSKVPSRHWLAALSSSPALIGCSP
ncbi:MAG: hypothetical protein Q8P67_09905, partial [archaeon]|nr:hypothetical protein [archaeon]